MRIGITELLVIGFMLLMVYSPKRAAKAKELFQGIAKTFVQTKSELINATTVTSTPINTQNTVDTQNTTNVVTAVTDGAAEPADDMEGSKND